MRKMLGIEHYTAPAKPQDKQCPKCGELFPAFEVPKMGWKFPSMCGVCALQNREEIEKEAKQEEIKNLIEYSGLKGKLLNHKFNDFEAKQCPKVFDLAQTYARSFLIPDTHKGLIFTGKPGTGKTHLVCAMANYMISTNQIRVKFIKSIDLLFQIRWAMNKDFDEEKRFIESLANVPLLIIDDLGSEKITDWAQQVFYKIIDDRDILEKPIIITSNIDIKGLAERIGDRTASRLASMCQIVQMGNEDFRLKEVTNEY